MDVPNFVGKRIVVTRGPRQGQTGVVCRMEVFHLRPDYERWGVTAEFDHGARAIVFPMDFGFAPEVQS
jgi:hypothetical protein